MRKVIFINLFILSIFFMAGCQQAVIFPKKPIVQQIQSPVDQYKMALCKESYSDCQASFVQNCKNSSGQDIYKVEFFCTDLPNKFFDEQGKFLESCGGMPLPSGSNKCHLDIVCEESDPVFFCNGNS